MTKVVWLDLDDVLCELTKGLLDYTGHCIAWVPCKFEDFKNYNIHELDRVLLDKKEMTDLRYEFINSMHAQEMKITPYAKEFLSNLKKNGYDIHIITGRDKEISEKSTISRVQKNFGECITDVHFSWYFGNNIIPKSEILKRLNVEFFVDDSPIFCNDIVTNMDIPIYMPNKPWNIWHQMHPRIIRINWLDEIKI